MRTLDKVKYTKGNKDLQSVNSEQDIELKVTNGEMQFSTDGTNFANVSADMLSGTSNPTSSTNGKEGQLYRNTLTDDIFILGWKVFGVPVWILLGGNGKQNNTKAGAGAPTTSTSGLVGQFYYDTTNKQWYYLSSQSGSTFTWTKIGTVPSGGTQGQVLTKDSDTDYDASWKTPSGGGKKLYKHFINSGGLIGEIINDASEAFTTSTLVQYLKSNNITLRLYTNMTVSGGNFSVFTHLYVSGNSLYASYQQISGSINNNAITFTSTAYNLNTIVTSDTVIEL